MSSPWTAARVVEAAAALAPDEGLRFISEDGDSEALCPYGALVAETARVGGALQAAGLARGERVALVLPDNREFAVAFLGAVRAGLVPVPIYPPPGLRNLDTWLDRTLHIADRAGARLLVTDAQVKPLLGTVLARASGLGRVATLASLQRLGGAEAFRPADVRPEDTCFLQFTSGSTAAPKGVVVSHANLAANIAAFMGAGLGVGGEDSALSWLPLYHDMGLIGFVFGPMSVARTVTFMPPLLFLKRPARWLQEISRRRATISFGPSFAYALAVKRIKDREVEGLDLSCWRAAGCGAEPIRAPDLRAFAARFAGIGFDPSALLACYGMAEATLAVSFDQAGRGLRTEHVDADALSSGRAVAVEADAGEVVEVVNCGRTFDGHAVAAFSPDDLESGQPLPDRAVGELRVRGPSVTTGYFDAPEQTAAAFAGGWLRTGDLGYLVADELFVCGRSKELIIVNGRNYYPQDLEQAAGAVAGVRKGNVIAFGVTPVDAPEAIVIAFETAVSDPEARAALPAAVQREVLTRTGLRVHEAVALAPGGLPKTSSGKLERRQTRALYERGELAGAKPRAGRWHVARELARSQLGYLRAAVRRGGPGSG